MRAVDDSSVKYAAVLRVLQTWKQLPESDIVRILRDHFLVTDDFREMEEQGLLTMSFQGDEYIISQTTLGRLWLEQYSTGAQ
jgi:predicted HAD superfamily phosphohydrolase